MDKVIPQSVQKRADYKRKEKLHKHINTFLAIIFIIVVGVFIINAMIKNS